MWKHVSRAVLVALFAIGLALPQAAQAVTYEDSFDQCNYPKTFDLFVMRPISMATIALGSLFFIPAAPMALLTVPEEVDTVYENLIGAPVRFTFGRALGECTGVDLSY